MLVFGIKKEDTDLKNVSVVNLAKHDQIIPGPLFRVLAAKEDDKGC